MSKRNKLWGRLTTADIVFDVILIILGVLIFVAVAYPMYFVVIASFSDPMKVASGEVWLWPKEINFYGYKQIFDNTRIWIGYKNTVIYATLGTIAQLLVTLPAAYTLSRKNVLWKGPIMFLFTFAMFFNGGMIPTYFIYKAYGLLDTLWVMVLPSTVGIYNMIIARTFFQNNIPDELLNAAQIDGCNDFRFYVQMVLPLSSAIIAVVALYQAVAEWNSYLDALLYLRDESRIPLQLVLREILVASTNDARSAGTGEDYLETLREAVKYGVIIISTLPLMIVYPFLQKYFNKGVMIGAVKG